MLVDLPHVDDPSLRSFACRGGCLREVGWIVVASHECGHEVASRTKPEVTAGGFEMNVLMGTQYCRTRSKIYSRQARFRFDAEGRLWLHARHPGVTIDGVTIPRLTKRRLPAAAVIAIGSFRYLFRWTVDSKEKESMLQGYKYQFMKRYSSTVRHFTSLAATPTEADVRVGPWILYSVVAHSALSIIHAASRLDHGAVVAIKCLLRSSTHAYDAKNLAGLEIYSCLETPLRDHPDGEFVMKQLGVIPTRKVVKRDLSCQALLGLQALHDLGWIHRELKPDNLCVVTLLESAPQAVVIDLGQATRYIPDTHRPRAYHCGTVNHLAPELQNPYYTDPECNHPETEHQSYDQRVDTWSMGAVGVTLFHNGIIPWSSRKNIFRAEKDIVDDPALQRFMQLHQKLALASPASLDNLIYRMLMRHAEDQPHINKVLFHPALQETTGRIHARQYEK
nr:ribosomal protein s6 kinase alpha-5 [Quercus suber]